MDKIFGLAFLVTGPCGLVYSLFSVVRTRAFIRRSAEVTGEVIRLERDEDRGSTRFICYAPVFSFTAADGKTYTVTSEVSSSPAGFSVGESVRVRYDKANPQNARIHTYFQTWGAAAISGVVGAGFVAGGCQLLGILHLTNWLGR